MLIIKYLAVIVPLTIMGLWTTIRKASVVVLTDPQEQINDKPVVSRRLEESEIHTTRKHPLQKAPPLTSYDASQEPFGESFSACLMWMDDYQQLSEWIAYHYHVLPLRYLVFFRDPKSQLDPKHILDKWKDRIHVEYWTQETDYMTEDIHQQFLAVLDPTKKYVTVQSMFYHACLDHLKQQNRTWTLVIDTDEYLSLDADNVPNVSIKLQEPGAALDLIKRAHARDPSTGITAETPKKWFQNCTGMNRKEYTSFESPSAFVHKGVPAGIDPYRLATLRFRHVGRGLIGKSMLDVSSLDMATLQWIDISAHKLFRGCIGHWGNGKDLMYVGHYLGSIEAYQRPSDRRNTWMNRTKRLIQLNEKSVHKIRKGKGDEIRPWIHGFAEDVGLEQLHYLLSNVGFPFNTTTAMAQLE